MENEIILTQSLDVKTIEKVNRYLLFSGRIKYYILIFLLIIIVNVLTNFNYTSLSQAFDIYTFIPIILFAGFIPLAILSGIRTNRKTIIKNSRYYTNITFTINNSLFKKQGDGFEITNKWEELVKIKETPKWFLIYVSKNQAHVIDKAQLDPWQKDALNELFASLKLKIKIAN